MPREKWSPLGRYRSPTLTGYIRVYRPGHPLAHKDGYVLEHRFVAYEGGLLTDPKMNVHHINGDKTDNRLENLAVMGKAEHHKHHMATAKTVTNQYGVWTVSTSDEERHQRDLAKWRRSREARRTPKAANPS